MTGQYLLEGLAQALTVFYFYNGTQPAPGVFDEFNSILPLLDQVKPQRYAAFVSIDISKLRGLPNIVLAFFKQSGQY